MRMIVLAMWLRLGLLLLMMQMLLMLIRMMWTLVGQRQIDG